MKERKAWQAVLAQKCPKCREGNMFAHKAYNLKKFGEMPENCPHCGMRFEREPGFFYGAMYVSYILSVGIFLVTSAILYFVFGDPELEVYLISVTVVSIFLYPLVFRYSRVLFLTLAGGNRRDS